MKKVVCAFLLIMMFTLSYAVVGSMVTTNPEEGLKTFYGQVEPHQFERIEELWVDTEEAAICGDIAIGTTSGDVAAGWYLNDIRMSMYQDSSNPEWEFAFDDPGFDYPVDMTPDGYTLLGAGSMLWTFNANSATPDWQMEITGSSINNVEISSDGAYAYCSAGFSDHVDIMKIEVDGNTVWTLTLDGGSGTLDLSDDNGILVFTQYGGSNSFMTVIDTESGAVLFTDTEYNQNPPALSYDGSIIVNGDYSGYVHVYQRTEDTYEEIWNFHVNSGNSGSNSWIGGMAVSGDGSTIAVGTLMFNSAGYDGEIYVFDTEIPEPLWMVEGCGDYVCSVDISYDGSLIAVGGYGPSDNSGPDFYLFRKQSSEPLYTVNTSGSIFKVELADEGGMCAFGGKAVHARVMGSGGLLYRYDAQPDGGMLTGTVNLNGYDDNSNVLVTLGGIDDYQAYTDVDGYFEIPYVPANTYMVSATKTGFGSETDVAIIEEDGVANIDLTLEPNGPAPTDLVASQSFAQYVRLDWTAPENREIQSYNIYRKNYMTAPFDTEPVGTAGGEETMFEDNNVLPLREYYYVITAVIDDLETPYSNVVTGWASTSYIVDQVDAYVGTVPTIDGTIEAEEWEDAFVLVCGDFLGTNDNEPDPMRGVVAYFKVDEDMTNLYMAVINGNDTVFEDHDEVGIYIDDNNDGLYPENGSEDLSEGNFWAVHYASGDVIRYRPCFNPSGVGTTEEYTDWQVAITADDEGIYYEYALPIGDQYNYIQPDQNDMSGLGLFVLDDPSSFNAWWPPAMQNIFKPVYYGTIHFGAENEIPPAVENLSITGSDANIILSWDDTEINDLLSYDVYMTLDGNTSLLGNSEGLQYYAHLTEPGLYEFYVITVDQAGQESDPSTTVEYQYSQGSSDPTVPAFTGINAVYPNPFNPTTNIAFSLKSAEKTRIDVFNIRGQRVTTLVNETLTAGNHMVSWQGLDKNEKQVGSGVYFIRLEAGETTQVRKALLLK